MIQDTWLLLAIFSGCGALAIWLEKTKLGGKLGSALIALILGMIIININLIPAWSGVHDMVFSYVINLAIPLLLFKADLRRIFKMGPQLLSAFALGTIGTLIGAFIAPLIFNVGPETYKAYGIFAATYIGGSVNMASVGTALDTSPSLFASISAADVIVFFVYMLFLMRIGYTSFFKKHYVSYKDISHDLGNLEMVDEDKSINLANLALVLGAAFCCAAVGEFIGGLIGFPGILFTTTSALLLSGTTKIGRIADMGEKFGNYLVSIFLVVIGALTVFTEVINAGPTLLFGAFTVIAVHCVVVFGMGKVLKLPLEYLIIASSANVGGPTTTAPVASGYKWIDLVLPAVLLGLLGYILGTYLGLTLSYALQGIL